MKLYTEKEAEQIFKEIVLKDYRKLIGEKHLCKTFPKIKFSCYEDPEVDLKRDVFFYDEHYGVAEDGISGWHEAYLVYVAGRGVIRYIDGDVILLTGEIEDIFEDAGIPYDVKYKATELGIKKYGLQ